MKNNQRKTTRKTKILTATKTITRVVLMTIVAINMIACSDDEENKDSNSQNNENKEIVKIHRNTTPFSEKSLPSEKKAMYVVEVVAGFSDKYGVKEGDKINFQVTNY